MPLMRSVRKLFTRRRPLELSVTHRATGTSGHTPMLLAEEHAPTPLTLDMSANCEPEPDEPLQVLGRIEQVLEDDRDARHALRDNVAHLPEAISSMTTLSERQQTLIEITRGLSDLHRASSTLATQHAQRLQESLDRQNDTMGLIQRQLDANHQVASHTAETLIRLGEGITESTHTARQTGEAMTALSQSLTAHRTQQDTQFKRLQGWMIATAIACIATVIASVALSWILLKQ